MTPGTEDHEQGVEMNDEKQGENGTTTATMMARKEPSYVVGIDLGSDTAVVAMTSTKTVKPDILRNDLSNQKTPGYIAFNGSERLFGEVAKQMATTQSDNTVVALLRSLGMSCEEYIKKTPWYLGRPMKLSEEDPLVFQVSYDGNDDLKLRPEQLCAMFLTKLMSFATKHLEDGENAVASVVIPDCFNQVQRKAMEDALEIAGIEAVRLVTRSAAMAMTYGTKRAEGTVEDVVMYVDVGDGHISATVYQWEGKKGKRIAMRSSSELGSGFIDALIFQDLCKECETNRGHVIKERSKGAIRLRAECRKLKENLSLVPEAAVTCENLIDGNDAQFTFTRDRLEQLCAPAKEALSSLLEKVLEDCQELRNEIKSCQLIGGGMRVPWVEEAIRSAIGGSIPLAYTLDPMTTSAVGASFVGVSLFEPQGGIRRPAFDNLAAIGQEGIFELGAESELGMSKEKLDAAKELEMSMRNNDHRAARLAEARNHLEAFILDTRSAVNGGRKFSELIDRDPCLEVLRNVEDWMYEDKNFTETDYKEKLEQVRKDLEPSCGEYLRKVEEDRVATEKHLEEESAKAAAELEAGGGKDDHDFRKLSKPDRMKKVTMNKDEGNGLFKDGNYEPASLRYTRALQHCDKFFDLSPEDEQEVNEIKHLLHLNLAQCNIKLEKWESAIKHADQAIEINATSTKALYRRAFCYEKIKELDKARKDLKLALELASEDKAINRLMERVNAQLKREKAKQKKMAQKMFA